MTFKMLGRTKTMASYGISQIKINEQQQIIFQQDFWDPANGLYRSLPVFGGVYKWILPFKKSNLNTTGYFNCVSCKCC